jgi:hypothetical protein
MSALTIAELADERAELLPERDTLLTGPNINVAPLIGVNLAFAINAATVNSTATANANQFLGAIQLH